MTWIYPDVVCELKKQCLLFLKSEIEMADLQASIYQAEQQIVALEEVGLRALLFDVENAIELMIHTTDESQWFQKIKPVIESLLNQLS